MSDAVPHTLAVIAGRGVYPRLLAESARRQGVAQIVAVAFRRETDRSIERAADRTEWIRLGQLQRMLDAIAASGAAHAVMAGQITPTRLFTVRMDRRMKDLLRRLPARNAHTIFGAIGEELRRIGVSLLPASSFMRAHMPEAGLLARRHPTPAEERDIALGLEAARTTSALEIGQTVVVKDGTLLAVEAFEGTDETLRRAGRLGGRGAVVVKVAKLGHDMRFDIPVIGPRTMKRLRSIRAAALAVEAGRAILLERDRIVAEADRMGLCLLAVPAPEPGDGGSGAVIGNR